MKIMIVDDFDLPKGYRNYSDVIYGLKKEHINESDYVLYIKEKSHSISLIKARDKSSNIMMIINFIADRYLHLLEVSEYSSTKVQYPFKDFVYNQFEAFLFELDARNFFKQEFKLPNVKYPHTQNSMIV